MSLKRIAEELGLSLTTVSRALNGYPEVAAATRRDVMAAALRLNYKPDARARGLALGRADAVGIVFPITTGDLGDQQFLQVASSMSERFAQAGLDLLIMSAPAQDELAAYERAITGRHIGVFVVPRTRLHDQRLELLQSRNVPFVAYGRSSLPAQSSYPWFDFDNLAGARMATDRLLRLGHRRIGYLGAPPEYNFADQRYAGFCASLKAAGVALKPTSVQRNALERRSGYAAMQKLLALPQRPTAVLVDNNLAGIGAVHAVLHSGLVLGRDLSVIVYDGLGSDSVVRTSVTAVMQPTPAATGLALAELTLARMRDEPVESLQKLCMPELEIGDSDGPPPATS
ncbi:LacI family transcriptional regulator [Rhodoferax ferrireducens]|uniref:LacI family transcriptional regulator n=1 Tax=Rhodoferax ferrireducens TaxID=192843 RepID=A0ABU2CCP0_9BURK|nr:substrate-binding domain-containing protein [Rhodoferax ferrireducens]MDR7379084.1 LacI family transcriptional regulator [Rhodoferax ferrireducens]